MLFFVIEQHDFDNMENHSPHLSRLCAAALTSQEAWLCVKALKEKTQSYKGWDGHVYPHWHVQVVAHAHAVIDDLALLPKPSLPDPEPDVVGSSRFKTGDRIKLDVGEGEESWVEGTVLATGVNCPYPAGYPQTHGPALKARLDTNVMTGWLPEDQFQPADSEESHEA